MTMLLQEGIRKHRAQILEAAAASGALQVRVFGSVARGTETDASDVDFLVSLERGRTLLDLARLEIRLEQLLGRSVDVVTEGSLQDPIRETALREAVNV
jgi:predicted nucleotidyltransferase